MAEKWDVFLSYARRDQNVVRALWCLLKASGLSVWFDGDPCCMPGGADWKPTIKRAISRSRTFLACMSASSVGKRGFVQAEQVYALEQAEQCPENEVFIIPLRLSPCVVPERLSRWHVVNLSDESGLTALFVALRSALDTDARPAVEEGKRFIAVLGEPSGHILQLEPNEQVSRRISVTCALRSVPSDRTAWLACRIAELLWPKVAIEPDARTGLGEATIYEGGSPPSGRFEICLLAVGATTHRDFVRWQRGGEESGDFPGWGLPPDTILLDCVPVRLHGTSPPLATSPPPVPAIKLDSNIAAGLTDLATTLHDQRRFNEAIDSYSEAIDIYGKLIGEELRTDLYEDLADSYNGRGNTLRAQRRLRAALEDYDKAVEIYDRLVQQESRTELANERARCLTNRGNAFHDQRKLDRAMQDHNEAVETRHRLVKQEGQAEFADDLADSLSGRGNTLRSKGKLDDATRDYSEAIDILRELVDQEGRTELENNLARCLTNLGNALTDLGRFKQAAGRYAEAIEIRKRLVNEEGGAELEDSLADSLANRGTMFSEEGRFELAIGDYTEAIEIRRRLVEQEGRVELGDDLADSLNDRGEAFRKLRKLDDASRDHREAIEIRKRFGF